MNGCNSLGSCFVPLGSSVPACCAVAATWARISIITRRSAANSIPVSVATGGIVSEFAPERREALRKMANGYLNKPFGSEELVTTLAEVLPKSTAS